LINDLKLIKSENIRGRKHLSNVLVNIMNDFKVYTFYNVNFLFEKKCILTTFIYFESNLAKISQKDIMDTQEYY